MFGHILYLLIRTFLIPAAAIYGLSQSFVGLETAFLGVNIILTILLIPMAIWHAIKILPNLALIRTREVLKLFVEVVIEIFAIIAFWVAYLMIVYQ